MTDINYLLRGTYATRGGKIDPWGTIRILEGSVPRLVGYTETEREFFCLQPGLPVWSEKLLPYGRGAYHAEVTSWDTVYVLAEDDSLVEEIPYKKFVPVELRERYVHKNGYLEYALYRDDSSWTRTIRALDQAARGERPCYLDNSDFTKVDEKLAGKEVVEIEYGSRGNLKVIVFTREGERIESKTHYPLSFAKWAPGSSAAKYSVADEACS